MNRSLRRVLTEVIVAQRVGSTDAAAELRALADFLEGVRRVDTAEDTQSEHATIADVRRYLAKQGKQEAPSEEGVYWTCAFIGPTELTTYDDSRWAITLKLRENRFMPFDARNGIKTVTFTGNDRVRDVVSAIMEHLARIARPGDCAKEHPRSA